MTESELAFAAGIIAGEGCISIDKEIRKPKFAPRYTYGQPPRFRLAVYVQMCDNQVVNWLVDKVGVDGRIRITQRTPRHAFAYRWALYGERAANFLKSILPYLVGEKKPQAELAIEFEEGHVFGRHRTEERVLYEWDAYRLMSAMKFKVVNGNEEATCDISLLE